MRLPDLSTQQPTLVIGEPGCPDLAGLTAGARRALLSASFGSLRPGGSGWFGPDKLHRMWVGVPHFLFTTFAHLNPGTSSTETE